MSSRNDNGIMELSLVLGFVGGFGIILAYVIFWAVIAGAIALSASLTIIALCAWNKPLHIGGEVIQPHEAREFVYDGLIGSCLAVILAFAGSFFFEYSFTRSNFFPSLAVGYVVASILASLARHSGDQSETEESENLPAIPPKQEAEILPPPQSQPFKYASWDDEEELR